MTGCVTTGRVRGLFYATVEAKTLTQQERWGWDWHIMGKLFSACDLYGRTPVCGPQQCMLLVAVRVYTYLMHLLTLSVAASVSVSSACFIFSCFVKIPYTGQDAKLFPGNHHPRPLPSLCSLSLWRTRTKTNRKNCIHAHTHSQNVNSYVLLCKSRGSERATYLVLNWIILG